MAAVVAEHAGKTWAAVMEAHSTKATVTADLFGSVRAVRAGSGEILPQNVDAELLRLREGGSGLQRKIGDGLQRKIGDGYWRSGRILGCEAHTVVAPQVKCAQDGL